MKILMIHNKYGKHSGEEAVANAQVNLLEEKGHNVITYFRSSEELEKMSLAKVKSFFWGVRNNEAVLEIKKVLEFNKPDIVHIHNLYPIISPAILPIIKEYNIPVVMTVHNYRLLCPNGLLFTKGEICEKCTGVAKELNCITNNCEGSIFKSSGYALRNFWSRVTKKYIDHIDGYLCLNHFQKDKLITNGFKNGKFFVIPNFYRKEIVEKNYNTDKKEYVAFAGRLSPEKGLPTLFQAAKLLPHIEFQIAGLLRPSYKPELDELDIPQNVVLRGMLNPDEMDEFYSKAKMLVHTSVCYEGFAMVFPEAMVYKLPIIAQDFGSYPEMIKDNYNGLLFKFKDSNDLSEKILELWNNTEKSKMLGENGFEDVKENYSKDAYYKMLISAYQKVVDKKSE